MKILITNVQLNHRTGTEIVVRDLERALRHRGHEVCVYTPDAGDLAAEMVDDGAVVVRDPAAVPFVPDVIHGHHHTPTMAAIARFPSTPAVFVCHDRRQAEDAPPSAASIHRYVAVDLSCHERLVVESSIDPARVVLVHNAVDLERLPARGPLPARPARAVVFSNNARPGNFLDQVAVAAAGHGLDLTVVGDGVGRALARPEGVLADADIVFAKARCALEALAIGSAVVLVDEIGLGPMVTSADLDVLRDWNFGARCLQGVVAADALAERIARYDAADAAAVVTRIREVAGLERCVDQYEALYLDAVRWWADAPHGAGGWHDDVRSLLQRLERAERLSYGDRDRLFAAASLRPPLPPTIGEQVSIVVEAGSRSLEAAAGAWWQVRIDNRSNETLASVGAHPVQLACHLVDESTGAVVLHEGLRTELTAPVTPGSRHVQRYRQVAPSEPGRYVAVITLVQEGVFWFDDLPTPVLARAAFEVRPAGEPLSEVSTLAEVVGLVGATLVRDGSFRTLGFSSHVLPAMLSFAATPGHLRRAVANGASAVLVTPSLADLVPSGVACALVDRPAVALAALHHLLLDRTAFYGDDAPTWIDRTASVHPDAHVAPTNVVLGPGCTVHPGAVVTGRVRLGRDVEIGPGAILGAAGFQRMTHEDGRPGQYRHAGSIDVRDGAQVMAGAVVARGLFRQTTTIGERTLIGNQAFVSHNARIGDDVHVGHGAVVNGNVTVGDDVWIGPGATVAHDVRIGIGAHVALGSVVVADVDDGAQVAGIASMPRMRALRAAAELGRRGTRATP